MSTTEETRGDEPIMIPMPKKARDADSADSEAISLGILYPLDGYPLDGSNKRSNRDWDRDEYLAMVAAVSRARATSWRYDKSGKARPSMRDQIEAARRESILPDVSKSVNTFAASCAPRGGGANESALVGMMQGVPSFLCMALVQQPSQASELLFFPDYAPKSRLWRRATFGKPFESNEGWGFFKDTMYPELEELLKGTNGNSAAALAFLQSNVTRQQTVFYAKLLPEALRKAGLVVAEAKRDAVTCFVDGRALVLDRGAHADLKTAYTLLDVPTSCLMQRMTRHLPVKVHHACWVAPEQLSSPEQDSCAELQKLLERWFVDTDVREYVLDSLASVLFGRHALRSTKVMFINAGSADCGKTLFMELVQTAFAAFVNRTNLDVGAAARTTLVQQASGYRLLWVDELQGGELPVGVLKDVFTSGAETTARGAHSNKQGIYAPGCALWVTCNTAQLPPKPEDEDTLKKIAFFATEDTDGKRLLGSFVPAGQAEAASVKGVFPTDPKLRQRIKDGEFSGALIRMLIERLRANLTFDAFSNMPTSLKAKTAWPAGAGGGPSGAVAGRSLNEVLAECLEPATDTLVTRFDLFKHLATTELETWQRIGGPKTVVIGKHTKDGTAYATAIDASLRGTFPDCVPPEVFTKYKGHDMVYPCFLNLKGKTYPPKNKIESTSVLVGFRLKADDAASSAAGALTDLATGST